MIAPALTTIITGNTTINAAISGRFRPVVDIAEGLPAIYYIVRALFNYNKTGQHMQTWRVTFLVMHNEYKAGWNLAMKVKEAMEAKERQTVSNILMQRVECQQIADEYDFPVECYVHSVDFEIVTQTILTN
jgi:hypothetical protein